MSGGGQERAPVRAPFPSFVTGSEHRLAGAAQKRERLLDPRVKGPWHLGLIAPARHQDLSLGGGAGKERAVLRRGRLRSACELANVRGDKLVFVVDAPVWHAKLRLATQALVDAARSVGLEVTGVSARTTTQPVRPLMPATTRTSMSAASQSGLEAALALLRSDAPEGAAGGDR